MTLFSEDALSKVELKALFPDIRTQAQYDAVALSLRALAGTIAYSLQGEAKGAEESQKALSLALSMVANATQIARRAEDAPEAVSDKSFVEKPKQFEEQVIFQELMAELPQVTDLQAWYDATKDRRSLIVSPKYRNPLFDAIRARKTDL